MSADSYYSLVTVKDYKEAMKKCLQKACEKLTQEYLYNYEEFKYHPYPDNLDLGVWGDADSFGEKEIMFSGTNTLKLVDADYFLIFFKEIARMEPAMPFDFHISYQILEGSFDMHINYDGYGCMRHVFINSLNCDESIEVRCPECGRTLSFDVFPEWFNPHYCPNCDADLEDLEEEHPGVEVGWEDVDDVVSDFLYEKLDDYCDHETDSIAGENIHVYMMAESMMDRDLLSRYNLIYDDVVSDTTNLIIIGSDFVNYQSWSNYGSLVDTSKAECRGDDRSDRSNWYVGEECITDFTYRNMNTKTAPTVIEYIRSLYDNGSDIPFFRFQLYTQF